MRNINYIITRGRWDGVDKQYKNVPWDTFVALLPRLREEKQKKEDAKMINLGLFKTINEGAAPAVYTKDVYTKAGKLLNKKGDLRLNSRGGAMPARNKVNMVGYDALSLDYDKGEPLDSILERFGKYELVYYTTYSHMLTGVEKCRIIIPFKEFCPLSEFTDRSESFCVFSDGATIDESTFSASRAFYLPSHPIGMTEYRDGHQQGEWLDWTQFNKNPQKQARVHQNYASTAKTVYSKAQMDHVISQLLYMGQFNYTDYFTIANALYNSGYTYADFKIFSSFWRKHEPESRIREYWDGAVGKAPMDFTVLVNILNGKSKIKFRDDPY